MQVSRGPSPGENSEASTVRDCSRAVLMLTRREDGIANLTITESCPVHHFVGSVQGNKARKVSHSVTFRNFS